MLLLMLMLRVDESVCVFGMLFCDVLGKARSNLKLNGKRVECVQKCVKSQSNHLSFPVRHTLEPKVSFGRHKPP